MSQKIKRLGLLLIVAVISLSVFFTGSQQSLAATQLTARSLTLSTATPSATGVTNNFNFNIATTGNIGSMEFLYCTTALSTCTAPTGLTVASATITTQTINGSAGGFSLGTNTANKIQITRTATSATAGQAAVFLFSGITNPSTSTQTPVGNNTFFVRITTYSAINYTGIVDTGTVASAIISQLQVSANIMEILHFCVGNTVVDDATSSLSATDCSGISGSSLNIGALDPTAICTSGPSNTCVGNDGKNGVAMIRSNAKNGVTVYYRSVPSTGTNHLGTLRVPGATCNAGNVLNDQCVDTAGTTQTTLSAGTERFGMTIGGVNCAASSVYGCTFSTGVYNLLRDTQYDGTGSNTYGTTQGYAWDETGTFDSIASSTTVVDDEALILKFAAAITAVTPAGAYSVNTDFVAVASY